MYSSPVHAGVHVGLARKEGVHVFFRLEIYNARSYILFIVAHFIEECSIGFDYLDNDEFAEVEGDADTLAGLLLELKGDFPSLHEQIEYANYTFEVMAVEERRISRIKVQLR